MALPNFDMRQLLEAGVHFGHQTHRWNPKMGTYIYGARNNIHIIDLGHTVGLLQQALMFLSDTAAKGGRILFVGTKRQASNMILESAGRCAQYYINQRWLGGTLTNWKTITASIKRLKKLEEMLSAEAQGFTKKELLQLTRERDKLERAIGGIKDMGGRPDAIFVIDTNKESIAIAEAKKLGIPVVAIIDTNSNPDNIDFPIPGNDDAGRAIALYCDLAVRAIVDGIERAQANSNIDIGALETVPSEAALQEAAPVSKAPEKDAAPKAEAPKTDTTTKAEASEEKAKPKAAKPKAEAKAKANKEEAQPAAKAADAPKPAGKEAKTKAPGAKTEKPAAASKAKGTFSGALKAPKGEADDLKVISGVGPKAEEKLNGLGVFHYSQIADLTDSDIEVLEAELGFKGRIGRDEWLKQAKALAK